MQLTHIAVWTNDLERLKEFYLTYFNGTSHEKYVNTTKGFESYFVTFTGGASLEIMRRVDIRESKNEVQEYIGLAHFAFAVDTKEEVDEAIARFRRDGYTITGEPRTTGDGFYEGALLDPDGNRLEVVVV